jgi:hypothetical protein
LNQDETSSVVQVVCAFIEARLAHARKKAIGQVAIRLGSERDLTVGGSEAAAKKMSAARRRRRKHANPHKEKRIGIIRGALEACAKGIQYCRLLDERLAPIPPEWRDEGCPDTHVLAYKDPKWRQRIQDEKSRIARGQGIA